MQHSLKKLSNKFQNIISYGYKSAEHKKAN